MRRDPGRTAFALRLAAVMGALLWLAEGAAAAQMSNNSGGLSGSSSSRSSRTSNSRSSSSSRTAGQLGSSRSSSSRSSRSNSRRDDSDDDESDNEDSGGSRSRSSSRRSSESGGSGTRSFSTGGSKGGGGGSAPEVPPIVFGSKFEREGVHPRGTLLSAARFATLPCTALPMDVGTTTYYRCGDDWYQRIEHEGWNCYSEIWPPAGARVSSLPSEHFELHGGGRTLYAAEHGWYERDPAGGYVVVEPPVGLAIDRLPQSAKSGIPVVVNGVTYHRHLGIFYREDPGGPPARYVVSKSPFDRESLAAVQPQPQTQAATIGQGASPTQPFAPSQPGTPLPSTSPAYLAPPVETVSPTASYEPAPAPPAPY